MYILCILIMAPAECHDFLQSLYQLSLIVRKVRKKLLNNKPFFKQKCRMKKYFWLKFLKSAFCHGFLAFVGYKFSSKRMHPPSRTVASVPRPPAPSTSK